MSQELFTKERMEIIIRATRDGLSLKSASRLANLDLETVQDWLDMGENQDEKYNLFYKSYQFALANLEKEVVAVWKSKIPKSWQAAERFLAKRFPGTWGSKNLKPEDQVDQINRIRDNAPDQNADPRNHFKLYKQA